MIELDRAIIISCRSRHIQEKLVNCFASVILHRQLPFPVRLEIAPPAEELEEIRGTHRCLFFIEADPDDMENSLSRLRTAATDYTRDGHQTVMIASSRFDYLEMAMRSRIGNIVMEDRFDAPLLGALVRRLLGSEFFGFGPFFPQRWHRYDRKWLLTGELRCDGMVDRLFHEFMELLSPEQRIPFRAQASELLANALSYGVMEISPEERDQDLAGLPSILEIPPGKEIRIRIVMDEEKYGMSVMDPGGTLTASRVLYKIRRHTALAGESLPPGIEDPTGRGLFLMSRQTRLVVNILRGVMTEVILLNFFEESRNRYQSLIINDRVPHPTGSTFTP